MALKKWCLILVYQVQIYQLTADRHLILIRLEKRMILNHCR